MRKLFALLFLCIISAFFSLDGYAAYRATFPENSISFFGFENTNSEDYFSSMDPGFDPEFYQDSLTDKNDIAVYIGMGRPRPGFNHNGAVLLENKNFNDAIAVSIIVKYDTTATLISSNYNFTLIAPGLVSFYFDTLYAKEKKNISLEFYTPSNIALLGHKLWISANGTLPIFDLNMLNNYDSSACKIRGSFDPNAKSVSPEGFDFPNYIPVNQEELEYTINFQNTGTDTAFNVSIIDSISNYLDPYSVQPGASSHPYSWEILSPGILKFHFVNINLPDSNTNEPRSHGFITYTISTLQNLTVGVNIKNSAHIYFDFNPGILTNTTANELFDCNNISSFLLPQNTMCSGDVLNIFQNSVIPHISMWYVDSVWHASGDTFVFSSITKGLHQVILVAQTPYCDQIIAKPIQVITPSKPVITQNGFLLSSSVAQSYQWFCNGILIPGAQAISYLAPLPGWYSVLIYDPNGCKSMSDSVNVSNVGIQDFIDNNLIVYSNPFNEFLHLKSSGNQKINIQLLNLEGKVLKSSVLYNEIQETSFDTKAIPSGIYVLKFSCGEFIVTKLISKIK